MNEEQKKIEILKIVTDLSEKESDRGMARYKMMFFLQSVLIAVVSLKPIDGNFYVLLLISVFGIIFCFFMVLDDDMESILAGSMDF